MFLTGFKVKNSCASKLALNFQPFDLGIIKIPLLKTRRKSSLSCIDIIVLEVQRMNTRIRTLRKSLNLSQKEFAEAIGLKQNAISYMEKAGSTVTEQNIKAICSQFSVNENWLRNGTGEMLLESDRKQKEFFAIFDELSPVLQDYLIQTAKELLNAQVKLQPHEDKSFP